MTPAFTPKDWRNNTEPGTRTYITGESLEDLEQRLADHADAQVIEHAEDTTDVHGIVDASQLVYTDDARLSNQRVPPDGSVTPAKLSFDPATQTELNAAIAAVPADGSVTPAKLSFDPATQAELDAAIAAVSSGAYSDAQVRTLLAALSATTPDKIVWKYAGSNVVELWGQRVAAGLELALQDTWDTDNRSAYTILGAGGLSYPGGGVLREQTQTALLYRADYTATDTARTRLRARFNSAHANDKAVVGFRNNTAAKEMVAILQPSGTLTVYYSSFSGGDGSIQDALGVVVPAMAANDIRWVELTRAGNSRTVTIYGADGVTVLYTDTRAIPVGSQAALGTGVNLFPAFGMTGNFGTAGVVDADTFEYWAAAPEARELMVAVTAATSGTRTVKRLFGTSGSTGLRSDFAQMTATPIVRLRRSTNLVVATGTEPAITWDTEDEDTDTMHDLVTNPERITCKTAGLYLVNGTVQVDSNHASAQFTMRVNGVDVDMDSGFSIGQGRPFHSVARQLRLAVNDYVQFHFYANTGSNVNVIAGRSHVEAVRLAA